MFWDDRKHVFCFSHNEMVPTLEDFRALLGGDEAVNIAMPLPGGMSMVEKLSLLLGISLEEAQGMAHGPDHFIVSSFPHRFGNVASDEAWDAFAICVLGTLFTVYSLGFAIVPSWMWLCSGGRGMTLLLWFWVRHFML